MRFPRSWLGLTHRSRPLPIPRNATFQCIYIINHIYIYTCIHIIQTCVCSTCVCIYIIIYTRIFDMFVTYLNIYIYIYISNKYLYLYFSNYHTYIFIHTSVDLPHNQMIYWNALKWDEMGISQQTRFIYHRVPTSTSGIVNPGSIFPTIEWPLKNGSETWWFNQQQWGL